MSDVRPAGMTFSQFAAHMDTMIDDHGFVRSDQTATVPCDSCTVCCHHDRTEVMPWELERLTYLDTEPDLDGCHPESRKLKTRADGSCIHLSQQGKGCTVYEHRPLACRVYDCRYTNFLGMTMSYGGRTEPTWAFGVDSPADEAIAAIIAGMTDQPNIEHRMANLRGSLIT